MILRAGRAIDAPRVAELLAERLPDTCYAGRDEVDVTVARRLFAQAAQRHAGVHDGSTFFMVAVDDDDAIAAFMLGSLGRTYGVGRKLCAQDHYLLGRADCPPRVLVELFEHYLTWAQLNPRVIEIGASWSDAIPGSQAMGAIYERRGFQLCAQTYRLTRAPDEKAAA